MMLESVDMDKAYVAGRYGRGDDYINCPMTREEYAAFLEALLAAERALPHDFKRGMYFESPKACPLYMRGDGKRIGK